MTPTLAVAVHDVEPRSYGRCREIRHWLHERDVAAVTLLVIPAADLHPIGARAPTLIAWLREQVACGDAIGQHGLSHRASGRAPWPRSVLAAWQGGAAAEFPGLSAAETRERVRAGLRLLREVELDPQGFVAPGYAYTRTLRTTLGESFEWFADLRGVSTRSHGRVPATALCLGNSSALKRRLSPTAVRAAARAVGDVMRIDVHPADFDHPGHVAVLEELLARAHGRQVITYDRVGA